MQVRSYFTVIVIIISWLMPLTVAGQEAVVVLRSTVTGNQEQPKVLTIVPWQRPDGPSLLYQPMQSLIGELFTPIDREEFLREIEYRQQSSMTVGQPSVPDISE